MPSESTDKRRQPMTNAQRVAASRRRAINAGAQAIPRGILTPEAAQAMDALVASGWAASRTAAIAQSLVLAQKQQITTKFSQDLTLGR